MGKVIFETVNLSKVIEGHTILRNVSFRFEEKSAIAIRGQNGSGKSTFIKLLAGIYEPSSGKIKRNANKIGYVPEHFPENLRFKLKEYLLMIASFHEISMKSIESELIEYIRLFEIEPFINTPLKYCSKGTKQKVGIIQALLMKPDVLLLDEPLTGLDPTSQQQLIYLLQKLKKELTIIFTTHEDVMVGTIADQVLYVESGQLLFDIEPKQTKKIIKVEFPNKKIFTELNTIDIHYEGNIALLTVNTSLSDEILLNLLNKKCSVLEVKEMR
ncbi:ATP-binding cassette domain-containing protein [Bacillus sp. FJAT-22090]|uniref:ATP-binding cassette domain-containing protein n=1 Tax=Bacillus sp. FJAT-22090 TaxID=1581038 RepID=UPI0011A44868|nr:ABC transporter ATP-binding protein [Bacillus sp. FJAT-22090]